MFLYEYACIFIYASAVYFNMCILCSGAIEVLILLASNDQDHTINEWCCYALYCLAINEVSRYMFIYIYIYVCIYLFMYIYMNMCIFICVYTYVETYICIHIHIYTFTSLHIHMYVFIHNILHLYLHHYSRIVP
jgi:hypothetical protein